jgi:hypothetical protein
MNDIAISLVFWGITGLLFAIYLVARYDKEKPKTNGDKIRTMSNEELATVVRCPKNFLIEECAFVDCDECRLEWLEGVIDDD